MIGDSDKADDTSRGKAKDKSSTEELGEVFVISVAAELAGMHAQTLRTYDRMGLVTPRRTTGGGRRYSRKDVALLRKVTQAQPLLHGDGARIVRFQPGNDLHQRRLAAAVDADKAHALSVLQGEGHVAQHLVGAEAFLNSLKGK